MQSNVATLKMGSIVCWSRFAASFQGALATKGLHN